MSGEQEDKNPLTELKEEIRDILKEAESLIWEQVERLMKKSYYNGVEAGKKQASGKPQGDGDTTPPHSSRFRHGKP